MKRKRRRLNRKGKITLSFLILIISLIFLVVHLAHHEDKVDVQSKKFQAYMTSKVNKLSNENLNMQNENYDVSIYDVTDKKNYHWSKGSSTAMYTASTIKVPILVELLDQKGSLTDKEKQRVSKMIRSSSNSDAQALFDEIGGADALNKMFKRFKMKDSHANRNWWLSTMSSQDYIKLLKNIFLKSDKISTKHRNYIIFEMTNVDADQRWGASHFSKHEWFLANKNGWTLNNRWIMDSTGAVMVDGHVYLIAILSDNHPDSQGDSGLNKAKKEVNQIASYAGKYILKQ